MKEETTRRVAEQWFGALKRGDGQAALACLDRNVHWINNPPEKGLSAIIPWLGDYHGFDAVLGTFVIWGQLAEVLSFELIKLVIDGDEALAIVHEVAKVKATSMNYDIEFIQRFRVADEKIVEWKSYWDTVKGIVPFRGDMKARLIAAAQNGRRDEAMLVLPYGVDPNTVDDASGQTVLMIAAGRGHRDVVGALLDAGAAPNMLDARAGASALHKACQGGHLPVVQALVDAGALVDIQCVTTGHTPLVEAIWFKHPEIVAFLLDRGAGLQINTHYGFTLRQHVDYALRVNAAVAAEVDKLRRADAAVRARQERDNAQVHTQQLMAAVQAADLNRVKELLALGAAVDERYPILNGFDDGHTPLLVACRDGHTEIVVELLGAGADPNAVEPTFGAVPLHKAVYNGHERITEILVQRPGIKLDFQGATNGYTPLLDALWHGFEQCAWILLKAGARVDLRGHDGKSPLDLVGEVFGPGHELTRTISQRAAEVQTT